MQHWILEYGYGGIFSLLMLGIVGIPVPDEILLAFSGFLVSKGELHLLPTLAAAWAGSICGISLSYGLGRIFGIYLVRRLGRKIHITEEQIDTVREWFGRWGKWVLVFGYFLPGIRHLTAYVAGTSKLRFPIFGLFAYTGGLLWTGGFIITGYLLGEEWGIIMEEVHRHLILGSAVIAGGTLAYVLGKIALRQT
jgi:membrane protein DedA with SNARE-associated domain